MIKRRKHRAASPLESAAMHHNPLTAVPFVPQGIEAGLDGAGLIQVRRVESPRGRVGRTVYKLLHFRPQRVVKLDERGSFFWSSIDGERDLLEISASLATRFGVEPKFARESVMLFTKALMLKRLIHLKLPIHEATKS